LNTTFQNDIIKCLELDAGKTLENATTKELYNAVSKAALAQAYRGATPFTKTKRAAYLSAEFLIGRLIYSNLLNLGLLDDTKEILATAGIDINVFEDIEDDALGNGGLGRLAACFIDSAATQDVPLDGYGIRYKYGLFKQYFEDGFQKEKADDWQSYGDPWAIRREEDTVIINFANQSVKAVPYDMAVIGYGGKTVNNLRLWQAEAINSFDFDQFNRNNRAASIAEKNDAEVISSVLYPNDETYEGKVLRLKQQYFFSSASLKDMIRKYKAKHGSDFSKFSSEYAIQLNDTHPVVSIPEFLRILVEEEGVDVKTALGYAKETFAYTNHTIMPEALEKWSTNIFIDVIPEVYNYVIILDKELQEELAAKGIKGEDTKIYRIIDNELIHMARIAIYASHSTNGVAQIHTEILKDTALNEWYRIYPERFNNKTNGITQRRWLALSNRELSAFITDKIGDEWITNLYKLKDMEKYAADDAMLKEFAEIKHTKKVELAEYMKKMDNLDVNPDFIFDIQVKRLHEYKRQLLNAFSILDIYFGIKDGRIKNFNPTAFIFGAKAAPGYYRAKGIIKFINEIGKMIAADEEVSKYLSVSFVSNYNVSYAEKITPAADVSEQISTAGTEASGTGNMKFMLNGAVTLGTYDGANVEIVEQAGDENNYIFGARVEDIEKIADSYDPKKLYNENPRIKKVLDTLIDGTFDDGGTGWFKELYNSLLDGASWHKADHYYILLDLIPYCDAKLRCNADYSDKKAFTKKCFINMANAGKFSSDRTIKEYASDIWNV
jgi:starch phosphorylase